MNTAALDWCHRSTVTTNERTTCYRSLRASLLGTNNIDHVRPDFPAFAALLQGKPGMTASVSRNSHGPAILVIGNDPTSSTRCGVPDSQQCPAEQGRLYVVNLSRSSCDGRRPYSQRFRKRSEGAFASYLAGQTIRPHPEPPATNGPHCATSFARKQSCNRLRSELRGNDIASLVKFALGISGAKLILPRRLRNSRGAADMASTLTCFRLCTPLEDSNSGTPGFPTRRRWPNPARHDRRGEGRQTEGPRGRRRESCFALEP